jgi:hypothetical protein
MTDKITVPRRYTRQASWHSCSSFIEKEAKSALRNGGARPVTTPNLPGLNVR